LQNAKTLKKPIGKKCHNSTLAKFYGIVNTINASERPFWPQNPPDHIHEM
jgi:hypothetical protein